ncbi:MAG: hypothetical protein ACYDAY_06605 [Candidatus Dormibacteria bacterium]
MGSISAADVLLEATSTSLVSWVGNQAALPTQGADFLNRPTYASARILVNALDQVVHVYVSALGALDLGKTEALSAMLHTELPSLWTGGWIQSPETVGQDLAVGLAAKVRDWVSDLQASGQVTPSIRVRALRPAPGGVVINIDQEAISYLVVAGLDQWTSEAREMLYRSRLGHVQAAFGLRAAELARLLQVSREGLRRWFDGAPIAPERWADIDRLERLVHMLSGYFRPEVLPSLIRRKVPGLGNRSPMELIHAGREDELAAFYNAVFDRGVTQ